MTPNLGSYIRRIRVERQMSLRALAAKLDISAAFQSDIEHGRRYPSEEVLAQMAKALGVPLDEMKQQDTRVRAELKVWLQENPKVSALLSEFQRSGRPAEDLVVAWQRVARIDKPKR